VQSLLEATAVALARTTTLYEDETYETGGDDGAIGAAHSSTDAAPDLADIVILCILDNV
jgi:hypothetical protein